MEFFTPVPPEFGSTLGLALVLTSNAPLILLDKSLCVLAASASFCRTFEIDPATVTGSELFALGAGEWNVPQLRSLLNATVAGHAAIDAYEMDLVRDGKNICHLVLNAHRLEDLGSDFAYVVLAVSDVTAVRLAHKIKDDLIRERHVLLQELQHRVANSLQIIASVLMQSARRVQSEEARTHLNNAHHRVMSIATLQKQLAMSSVADVALRSYFTDLCASIGASMIADPERITLTATVDDSVTGAEKSVSLGLIVTELVINALKHAFPGRNQQGAIRVDYHSDGPAWELEVGDNGVGMPAAADDTKPGLGTGIVEALSKQLDATFSVTSNDPGTLVTIVHK